MRAEKKKTLSCSNVVEASKKENKVQSLTKVGISLVEIGREHDTNIKSTYKHGVVLPGCIILVMWYFAGDVPSEEQRREYS